MNIAGWFARIRKAVTIAHRHRSNYRTLAHLDDHLLRDIGLYVDQGIVRPLHPKTTETNVPMVAPRNEDALEKVETPLKVCPACGATLA